MLKVFSMLGFTFFTHVHTIYYHNNIKFSLLKAEKQNCDIELHCIYVLRNKVRLKKKQKKHINIMNDYSDCDLI